jgi:hypothetical protein
MSLVGHALQVPDPLVVLRSMMDLIVSLSTLL